MIHLLDLLGRHAQRRQTAGVLEQATLMTDDASLGAAHFAALAGAAARTAPTAAPSNDAAAAN